jgi:DNA-binding response OmpR family regulator
MRILLVEDDMPLADVLARCLREESYSVDHAADGQEAEWLATENPYDLIILDLMLPRKNGFAVLTGLREAGNKTPVLILTARDESESVVKGLDLGADDYLAKPYNLDELLARVRALLRRNPAGASAVMDFGAIRIDTGKRAVWRDGVSIELTAKEYALLEYFCRNPGTVVTRAELSDHVWDMNFEPTSNVVDVYVGYLRNKLDKGFDKPLLKTLRGHGYMLDIADAAAKS